MNVVEIPVRVLGYSSRVSTKNGKTYADLTARFGGQIVKFSVDPSKVDFSTEIDRDLTLLCEIAPAFQTQIATLRVVKIKE